MHTFIDNNFTARALLRLFLSLALFLIIPASTALAANWYVDSDNDGGTEDGTTWATAWGKGSDVVWGGGGVTAGDTLYISGGSSGKTYDGSGENFMIIEANGTSGNPITIRPGQDEGHNGVVTIDCGGGQYSAFFKLASGAYDEGQFITIDGEYNGDRHFHITGFGAPGQVNGAINISESGTQEVRNIIVRYVTITDSTNGITIRFCNVNSLSTHRCEVAYNWIEGISSDAGIVMVGSGESTPGWDAVLIHDNYISVNWPASQNGNGADGIKTSKGGTVYSNTITARLGTSLENDHRDGWMSGGNYARGYDNYVVNINFIEGFTGEYLEVFNNVMVWDSNQISHGPNGAITLYWGNPGPTQWGSIYIYNNTFIGQYSHPTIHIKTANRGVDEVYLNDVIEIKNNIFVDSGTVSIFPDGPYTNVDTNDIHFDYNSTDSTTIYRIFNVIQEAPQQEHESIGIPSFVDYSEDQPDSDFHLASNDTVAKDNGVALGSTFNTDKDGVARPQGGAWDIGAYEFDYNSDFVNPASPTGLTIVGLY